MEMTDFCFPGNLGKREEVGGAAKGISHLFLVSEFWGSNHIGRVLHLELLVLGAPNGVCLAGRVSINNQ